MTDRLVVEGFAGPGGWPTGLAMLGLPVRTVGFEWDAAACRTAHAAGHTRIRADVAHVDLTALAGLVWLLIMSPPCQAWSRSGKRRGILDQAAIFRHATRVTTAGEWIDYADAGPLPRRPGPEPEPLPEPICATCGHEAGLHDEGGYCNGCVGHCPDPSWIDQPARLVDATRYGDEGGTWHDARSPLVLEVLRWVIATQPANICLEQVPDVLPFWELIARWLRTFGYNVWAGCLSSERYGVPQTRERAILIASRERAVSAPPATHTAYDARLGDGGKWHGTHDDLFGGGLEPWVSMAEALGWVPASVVNTRGDRQTPGGNEFTADRPSWALTEKTRSWTVKTHNTVGTGYTGEERVHYTRPMGHPAPTVDSRADLWRLHTNRDQRPDGTRQVIDPAERPAPTLTAKSGGQWVYVNGNQANAARRDIEEPAPTVMFAERSNKVDWQASDGESVRVTVQEAAILQSFPPDYPWQGTKSAQFRQVGDAIPPMLAAHVLAACLGVPIENEQRRLREA